MQHQKPTGNGYLQIKNHPHHINIDRDKNMYTCKQFRQRNVQWAVSI